MMNITAYDVLTITSGDGIESRLLALFKFERGTPKILITTNLMARGIDIPETKLVINFDIPLGQHGDYDSKSFLHRIGRAGRFGRKGAAVTLIPRDESEKVAAMAAKFKRDIC